MPGYFFINTLLNFNDADDACQEQGADLAIIDTAEELKKVKGILFTRLGPACGRLFSSCYEDFLASMALVWISNLVQIYQYCIKISMKTL